jgi:hypothetical protein
LCIGCFENVHGDDCKLADPFDLFREALARNDLDKQFRRVEGYVMSIETIVWALRHQRDALWNERGECSTAGHLWDGDDCVLCRAEKG